MKINLNLLPYLIDDEILIPEEIYLNSDVKRLDKVKVSGSIKENLTGGVNISLDVSGKMWLDDAITNEKIEYPFAFLIDEELDVNSEESEKYLEKSQNMLDIIEFLWENIVLEVPIRVTNSAGTQMKGEGWELNRSDTDEEIDPRLEKLSELFKGGEE